MALYKGRELWRNVHEVEIPDVRKKDNPLDLFLCSDVHMESKKCDLDLFIKHLDEAKRKGALIAIIGDLFDLMEGRYDPRSNKGVLNEEIVKLSVDNSIPYLSAVVEWAFRILEPYAENICLIGKGNHETNIEKRAEFDLINALVHRLNMVSNTQVFRGGYSGYLKFKMPKTGTPWLSYLVKYHHGFGGAKRSKGSLNVDLNAANWPSADLVITGHTHHKWIIPKQREILTQYGKLTNTVQYHICLGGYKNDVEDGYGGWAVERGFESLALGGWWGKLWLSGHAQKNVLQEWVMA